METPTEEERPSHPLALAAPLLVALSCFALSPRVRGEPGLLWGLLGALAAAALALALAARRRAAAGGAWGVIWAPRWPLLGQVCAHSLLYAAWWRY